MTGGTERAEKSPGAPKDHPTEILPRKHYGIAMLSITLPESTYKKCQLAVL